MAVNTNGFHFVFNIDKKWRPVKYEEWKKASPENVKLLDDPQLNEVVFLVPKDKKKIGDAPYIFIQAAETVPGIFISDSLKKMANVIWTQNPYIENVKQMSKGDSAGMGFLAALQESIPYYDEVHKCIVTKMNYKDENGQSLTILNYTFFGEGWVVGVKFYTGKDNEGLTSFLSMIRDAQFEKEYRIR